MENLSKSLRKNISEIKEKKNNLIVEHSIVQSRLKFVLEQTYRNKNQKVWALVSEMVNLEEQGFDLRQLNEQFDLFGFLGSLMGGSVRSISQVIGEYITDAIADKFGINKTNYFYNVLRSAITSTNVSDYGKLFSDCRFLTNKICDSLIEAVITQKQAEGYGAQSGLGGFLVDALRNAVMEELAEKPDSLVERLEGLLSSVICDSVAGWRKNLANVGKEMQTKVGLA